MGEKDVLPRNVLEVSPYPRQLILIDHPAAAAGSGSHVRVWVLYIDEDGKVVRIRSDGPSLPAFMEEAARLAFAGAAFAPGHIDGLQVRSIGRVELVFEEGVRGR